MMRMINIGRMVRWGARVERVLLPSAAVPVAARCKSYTTASAPASAQPHPHPHPSYPCSDYHTHLPCSCHLAFQPKEGQCDEEDEGRWNGIRNNMKNDVYYSLAEKKVLRPANDAFYSKNNRLGEDLRNTHFLGSSCGWNLLLRPQDCSLHLLNPFFPNPPVIPLPPIESLPHVLSSVRRRRPQDHQGGSSSSSSSFSMEFSLSTHSRSVPSDELMIHGIDVSPLVQKFILSSSPWTWNHPHQTPGASAATPSSSGIGIWKNDCVAVIAGPSTLAFCRLGDAAWTALEAESECDTYYDGVAFCRYTQTLYAFTGRYGGKIEAWDLSNRSSPRRIFVKHFYPSSFLPMGQHRQWLMSKCRQRCYFVGLPTGGLLMAVKHTRPGFDDDDPSSSNVEAKAFPFPYQTIEFDLCELHFSAQKMESVFVEDLGDNVLLLDSYQRALVSARDFPELKPNCIYFVDDIDRSFKYVGHDMGCFSLNDRSIVPFFPPSYPIKIEQGATWIIPDPS